MDKKKRLVKGQAVFLYLLTVFLILASGLVNKVYIDEMLKSIILSLVFITIFYFVIHVNPVSILKDDRSCMVMLLGYGLSLVMVTSSVNYEWYNFWFLGTVIISMVIHPYLGVFFQFLLSFIYCILNYSGMEHFLYFFLMGTVTCVLGRYLGKKNTVVYSFVIAVSINITLLFVLDSFVFERDQSIDIVMSVVSTVLLFLASLLFAKCFQHLFPGFDGKKDLAEVEEKLLPGKSQEEALPIGEQEGKTEEPEEAVLTAPERMPEKEEKTYTYEEILDKDFPLIQQLHTYSKELYIHCAVVSRAASMAARELGADELLAGAGGMFHEIGRITGGNYILKGVDLGKEYHFPEPVLDIIKQHNIKSEKPSTIEAAIVMMIDSYVSTVEYVEKLRGKGSVRHGEIIENLFQVNFEKGSLDQSGMSLQEFRKLKEYLLKSSL